MAIAALEKAWMCLRNTHIDDILDRYCLTYLAITGHIQHDLPILITLVECWDLDCCIFHLPPGEMSVSLLDVYCI